MPAIGWSLFILLLSVLPGSTLPKLHWEFTMGWDKIAHLVVYAVQTVLLGYGVRRKRCITLIDLVYIFVGSTSFGALLEGIQYWFLPDRFFEVPDLIANIIGSLAGTFIVHLLRDKKNILWISQ